MKISFLKNHLWNKTKCDMLLALENLYARQRNISQEYAEHTTRRDESAKHYKVEERG